jgi:hypothetical protein
MQDVSHVSGALNDRSAGRWALALAATAAFMAGGGYLGSVGSAQAGGVAGNNVGSPERDGVLVTCYADSMSPLDDTLVCNPGNGEPGAVYRLVPTLAATPPSRAPHGGGQ